MVTSVIEGYERSTVWCELLFVRIRRTRMRLV
jgi:hypothetical protein